MTTAGKRTRSVPRILLLGLLWLCGHAPAIFAADNLRVLVVISDSNKLYQNFANTFKQNLPANIQVGIAERAEDFSGNEKAADLILTVGTKAAEWMAGRTPAPLLATLIPRHKYAELLAKRPAAAQTTAIYLDHSWARQAELLRAALPERNRIGVLYSPATRLDIGELRKQLELRGATLIAKQITAPNKLFDDLEDVLSHSNVLLAVPDSEIYNSNNIRNILLSSYRHGVPLIGFSQAFVNAGAMLALFSTLEQISEQAIAITVPYAQNGKLGEAQFPEKYSIVINREVARALGSTINPAQLLR